MDDASDKMTRKAKIMRYRNPAPRPSDLFLSASGRACPAPAPHACRGERCLASRRGRGRNHAVAVLAGALALTTACSPTKTTTSSPPIAHLEKRGAATQLMVDGKPFLALAGELTNTAASSPEHMKAVWPNLATIGLNTVLAPMAWAWI